MDRITAGAPFVRVDVQRIADLAPPPAGDDATPAAWEAACDRARVAVEAQEVRVINLELAQRFGSDAWKAHVAQLDAVQAAARARVAALSAQVEAVNAARKAAQEPAGARLKSLARRWEETAETNGQIQAAVADAEREVKRLRRVAVDNGLLAESAGGGGGGGAARGRTAATDGDEEVRA